MTEQITVNQFETTLRGIHALLCRTIRLLDMYIPKETR